MAVMIPTDGYFDPSSGEKKMFDALQKLPGDYFVFHSYRLVQLIPDRGLNENEIDFLIFHPDYGCLFIECKNSKVARDEDGNWKYIKNENGTVTETRMKDPFDQAFSGQHNLFNKLRETYPKYREIINDCKFMVGVWLPQYTKEEIDEANFGPNVTKEIILTREALLYRQETERQILALMERMNRVHLVCKYEEEQIIENGPGYKHNLSREDAMRLYKKVLCPTFRSIVNIKKDYEDTYIELLEEQYVILEFLTHQRTAAISGVSGTGKTLVAVQRARDLSDKGERVLFLCYNYNLMENLTKNYKEELPDVDFYTLAAFGCKKCNVPLEKLSYYDLKDILELQMLEGSFEYQHIIVDEGQDFGKPGIDDSQILQLLAEYGAGDYENSDTSFFIFYDKYQMVNAKVLPSYLQNVDSKLTLYKNCRNTKSIAATAFSLIPAQVKVHDRAWEGDTPNFIFFAGDEEFKAKIDGLIDDLSQGSSERVIITCADSLKKSVMNSLVQQDVDKRNYLYKTRGKKTRVYTSATFKGLEADDVILTDIDGLVFEPDNKNFYVAASRAKKRLFIFVDKERIDLSEVLDKRFKDSFPNPDKARQLALAMHGIAK